MHLGIVCANVCILITFVANRQIKRNKRTSKFYVAQMDRKLRTLFWLLDLQSMIACNSAQTLNICELVGWTFAMRQCFRHCNRRRRRCVQAPSTHNRHFNLSARKILHKQLNFLFRKDVNVEWLFWVLSFCGVCCFFVVALLCFYWMANNDNPLYEGVGMRRNVSLAWT